MIEPTLDTSGPRPTDTMKWGWEGRPSWVLVTTAGTQLGDTLDMNAQGLELLPDDALRHATAQVLHQQPLTAVLRDREGVETHTLPHQ